VQPSIINGVGERKIMFEKLFLALTITFSLNFFLQVRPSDRSDADASYPTTTQAPITILTTMLKK